MKPVPAIVEPAQIDVDLAAEQIIVAIAGIRDADGTAGRHQQKADAARETAHLRRLEVGRILLKVRPTFIPASGPKAKGWSEFLKRVGLDDSTALRYMELARTGKVHGQASSSQDSPHVREIGDKPANVHGGSGETERGKYCTPKKWADAVGPWDLDPFSNPGSHIVSTERCMLEDGGDGLVEGDPGSYRCGADGEVKHAGADARVFLQPPYDLVEEAIAHYKHTRFCALLRFAPDVAWFAAMWPHVEVVAIPFGERLPFEIDGVEADGAPFPHAFYYACEDDVTPTMRALCLIWRVEHETTNT